MKLHHQNLIAALFAIGLFSFLGCSEHTKYSRGHPVPEVNSNSQQTQAVPRLPWEVWPFGYTLTGTALKDRAMLQADQVIESGNRSRALDLYLRTSLAGLNSAEIEALTLRIASTQLALDLSQEALATLSKFFVTTNRKESDVTPPFALIFAYGYGRRGDIDQSLAWFSKVNRQASRSQMGRDSKYFPYADSAELGMRALLKTISNENLQKAGTVWANDLFITTLIGQEQKLRAEGSTQLALGSRPFWSVFSEESTATLTENTITPVSPSGSIGVVLPLSGQFAALGTSTKNGIELALSTRTGGATLNIRDDAGDSLQAAATTRELMSSDSTSMVIGPLLNSAASQAGEVARQLRRPLISLAKSSDFQTGDGVFRLGPTIESQVHSLLDAIDSAYQLTRFALVYPNDGNAPEYARVFRSEIQARGHQLVVDQAYEKGTSEHQQALAEEIQRLGAQAVFFPDTILSATRFFSGFAPQVRAQLHPLGTASWDNSNELQQSRTALEGAIFVSPFFTGSEKPAITQFISQYQARYNQKPDFLAAQGFDAAILALEALDRHHSQGVAMADALQSIQLYDGLTGKVRVQGNGEMERQFAVVALEGGRLREVHEIAAEQGTLPQ